MNKTKRRPKTVTIGCDDLLAAWTCLENLAVSLDQIGGTYATDSPRGNGLADSRAFHEALADYLTPELVGAIRDARARLAEYVSDADAERLTEKIAYWDYRRAEARRKR
jgi:hypothetical protein